MRQSRRVSIRRMVIPPKLLLRAWINANIDNCPLLAAGIAFYAFLSFFPALMAFEFLYSLIADPAALSSQIGSFTSALPTVARDVIAEHLLDLAHRPRPVLGIGLVIAVLVELWSVSGVIGNMMVAINTAYHVPESRGFLHRKTLAVGMTLLFIAFMIIVITLVVLTPQLANRLVGDGPLRWLFEAVRWLLLLALFSLALPLVYRVSPNRKSPMSRWTSPGAVVATALWFAASAGFSLYVATLGSYADTYGALAGVVVLLLWLWMTVYAILLGAEVNAELERPAADDFSPGAGESAVPSGEEDQPR